MDILRAVSRVYNFKVIRSILKFADTHILSAFRTDIQNRLCLDADPMNTFNATQCKILL